MYKHLNFVTTCSSGNYNAFLDGYYDVFKKTLGSLI